MTERTGNLSRRRLLAGAGMVLGGTAQLVGTTSAWYSESETAAGTVKIDRGPDLAYVITDTSKNSNASFDVQYQVDWAADFEDIVIDVENLQASDHADTYTKTSQNGTITYPRSGTDGGHMNDTYRFTFTVRDASENVLYQEQVDDEADGDGKKEGNFGSVNSPKLTSMTVDDNEQNTNGDWTVSWTVTNTADFKEVIVRFDHVNHPNWGNHTDTSPDPSGSVSWSRGGVGDDYYDITVEVYDTSDALVDEHTIRDQVDGEDKSWSA